MERIYLGSDIMTSTPKEMWEAMEGADLLPAKEGGDRNMERLRERVCELTGYGDAALVPTCTIANLAALMTHGRPGDQVVADAMTHFLWYEGNGVSAIAGLRTKLIDTDCGILSAGQVEQAMAHSVCHQDPRTAVIFLENTHTIGGGTVYPVQTLAEIAEAARRRSAAVHIDGARLFNAAVSVGGDMRSITRHADSVSINLNKILGVPFGALLCGSRDFIGRASRHIKMIGGHSMHKAGMLAAAAMVLLNREAYPAFLESLRALQERTFRFARRLSEIPGITVALERVQSNLFFMDVRRLGVDADEFMRQMEAAGVIGNYRDSHQIRLVVSTDRTEQELEEAAARIGSLAAAYR